VQILRDVNRRVRWSFLYVVLTVSAAATGYAAAHRGPPPAPEVLTLPPLNTKTGLSVAGGGSSVGASAPAAAAVPCTQAPPDPTFTCQNGVWAAGKGGTASPGGGGLGRAAGCFSAQPSDDVVCQDGLWVVASTAPPAAAPTAPTATTASPATVSSSSSASPSSTASTNSSVSAGGQSASRCTGTAPASVGWVCSGGMWVVQSSVGSQAGASQTQNVACTSPDPSAGRPGVTATCVNGTWIVH